MNTAPEPRVLLSWYMDPDHIPPPLLFKRQVTVGPSRHLGPSIRHYATLTPFGAYDLAEVLDRARIDRAFDAVIVVAAGAMNLPRNLAVFGCPKILCLADTHQFDQPLRCAIEYARSETFAGLCIAYDRHHAHWFRAAGFADIAWFPSLAVRHCPRLIAPKRKPEVVFVGSLDETHPRRVALIEKLRASGIKVNAMMADRDRAADAYAASVVSFNCSLNADLNMRVFEVLSSGGFLLTDRLAPESGLSELFQEDRDIACYDDVEELSAKVRRYLGDPYAALRLARSGHKAYRARHTPRQVADELTAWIRSGRLETFRRLDDDRGPRSSNDVTAPLTQRLPLYEHVQKLHKNGDRLDVLIAPGLPPVHAFDLVDLPRVRLAIVEGDPTRDFLAARLGRRIAIVNDEEARQRSWTLLIASKKNGERPKSEPYPYGSRIAVG